MKKTVFINAAHLPTALRVRFQNMLEVAGRRSIVSWELTEGAWADVVIHDRMGKEVANTTPIYITDTPLQNSDVNLLRLETEFRLNALMDVLDLAAVRVMNRREYSARMTTQMPVAAPAPVPTTLYRLKHWVILGGQHSGPNYMRVLAAMSREAVSRDWIMRNGRLSEAQVEALLTELQNRGALIRESNTHRNPPTPPRTPTARPSTEASRSFVSRLKRWIGGGDRSSVFATAVNAR